jgi:phosphoserine phosphatase
VIAYVLTAVSDPSLDAVLTSLIEGAVAGADAAVTGARREGGGLVVAVTASASAGAEGEGGIEQGAARARAAELRRAVAAACKERGLQVDLAAQPAAWRALPRLVVFDMDSTLITIEVIDELARRHGVGAEVAAVTERAMRGELDFEASLRARVERLRGLAASALDEVAAQLVLSDGAQQLIEALQGSGAAVAIASGGFTFGADRLRERLKLTAAYSNRLEIVDGLVTGRVLGDVVTAERKAEVVRELAAARGLRQEQTAAIGDGANDRLMLGASGFGVAFRAKPVLAGFADATIDHGGLDRVLAFFGHG